MAAKPFESRIQDLVYNVEVGVGLQIIKTGLYVLGIFIVMLFYTATQFKGFKDAEAMDYAQLGRNLLVHKQLVTQNIRPASMWFLAEHSAQGSPRMQRHPDILHPPLYPATLATAFGLLGANFPSQIEGGTYPAEHIVLGVGMVFTVLTGLLLYLAGLQLFERRVALLSVTLFFLSNMVWGDAISGLNVSMLMFLTVFSFYMALLAVTHKRDGHSRKAWIIPLVLSLLACIAAFLTRYAAIVLLPGLLLFYGIALGRKSWPLLVGFALLFLLGIAPWLARNQIVSGSVLGLAPYTALENTIAFEANTFERTLNVSFEDKGLLNALQMKWMEQFAALYDGTLTSLGDGVIIALFLTTFFYRFVRLRVHVLRWAIALSGVLLVLLAAFFGDSTARLLHVFYPFVVLYATAFFFLLLDRMQLQARILNVGVTILYALLVALPLIFALLPPREGAPYPPYYAPSIMQISNMLDPDELMCSDMPWATAWYGKRDSVELPSTIDEFYDINDYRRRISGLYFTTITRNRPFVKSLASGPYRTWFPLLQGRIPSDFPLREGIPINQLDQIFLTDRQRWKE